MQFYDLSRPLTPATAVYPGDTPVTVTHQLRLRDGALCNLSSIEFSVHAGTHVDAPRHCLDAGPGIESIPLASLIGRARVVTLPAVSAITLAVVQALDLTCVTRLLVHTRHSDVADDVFDPALVHFTPDAAAWLGAAGLRLIGTDAPSVDPLQSADLAVHLAFMAGGVVIVENLRLRDVPDGDYELIALPICIAGSDGAPARVVLRSWVE